MYRRLTDEEKFREEEDEGKAKRAIKGKAAHAKWVAEKREEDEKE